MIYIYISVCLTIRGNRPKYQCLSLFSPSINVAIWRVHPMSRRTQTIWRFNRKRYGILQGICLDRLFWPNGQAIFAVFVILPYKGNTVDSRTYHER